MERRETVTCPQPEFEREVPCPQVDSDAGKEQKVAGRTQGLRQGEGRSGKAWGLAVRRLVRADNCLERPIKFPRPGNPL